MLTVPPSGENLAAFESRLAMTCRKRSWSALDGHTSSPGVSAISMSHLAAGGIGGIGGGRRGDQPGQPVVAEIEGHLVDLQALDVQQVVDQ